MKTGLLFPGQGSQKPQMLHDLVRDPAVEKTLSEVSAALDLDVRMLDRPEALQSAVSVQLAILTAGVATARALQKNGLAPLAVAGLSVGAFSAAVAADSISLSDAVRLVRSRAEQMEQLYPVGYGLSAIGLPPSISQPYASLWCRAKVSPRKNRTRTATSWS
jgi:malonate decarboxylase epsilon subunit